MCAVTACTVRPKFTQHASLKWALNCYHIIFGQVVALECKLDLCPGTLSSMLGCFDVFDSLVQILVRF